MGRDFTLFAKIDGIVRYERVGKDRKQVHIFPGLDCSSSRSLVLLQLVAEISELLRDQ